MRNYNEIKRNFESFPDIEMFWRIFNFLNKEKQSPFKLYLNVTDRCNLNCFFCPNAVSRKVRGFYKENEMKDSDWLNAITDALKLGVRNFVVLGGGEPLLRHDLVLKIFKKVRKKNKNIHFEIITNGTLLNSGDLISFVKHDLNCMTVSVHGINEIYSQITGSKWGFEKATENLKLLNDIKKNFGKLEPIVQMNMVITSQNYTKIEEMIEFSENLGCNILSLHTMRSYEEINSSIKNFELNNEDFDVFIGTIPKFNNFATKKGIKLRTEGVDAFENLLNDNTNQIPSHLNLRCYEPWYSMLINSDGKVGRCAAFTTRQEPVNVHEEKLEKIWYGDFLEEIRKNVINNIMLESCSQCGLHASTNFIKSNFSSFLNYMEEEIDLEAFTKMIKREN